MKAGMALRGIYWEMGERAWVRCLAKVVDRTGFDVRERVEIELWGRVEDQVYEQCHAQMLESFL